MVKNNIYVGIDPGKSGAIAIINKDDLGHSVYDYPEDTSQVAGLIREIHVANNIILVALEKVWAMPGQGVTSMFNFGANFGAWQGILSAFSIPYILVAPTKWQAKFLDKLSGTDSKSRSLATARRMFYDADLRFKKHHGRADALFLALYAKQYGG